ncbi:MAG: ATP-dependent helicase [Lachnospiraceae bacterium]|nr:ATP-dependent helicase [Lachnospiraceae bacterium]
MTEYNEEQKRAVLFKDGPMLLLAGPGSGKTKVLVGRICTLIDKYGVDPKRILVLTFSREAAGEMQLRFKNQFRSDHKYNSESSVHFGTFHAVFYHILKKQGLYNESSILSHREKKEYIRSAARSLNIKEAEDEGWQEEMLLRIQSAKKQKFEGDKAASEDEEDEGRAFIKLKEAYTLRCRREKKIDFDDMILECIKLLKEIPKVLKKWQEKFDHILVDEFQDIDSMQYEILKLLSGDKKNLFMVGDDDQSIYGFRGAKPAIMQRLKEDFPQICILRLKINYRCRQRIIDTAERVIKKNKNRYEKKQTSFSELEGEVYELTFKDGNEEALYVADTVESLIKENSDKRIGILYRTGRNGDHLENFIKERNLLYTRSEEGRDYYDNEYIMDIISYFYLSIDRREKKWILRILNKPERGLSREAFFSPESDRATDVFMALRSYYKYDREKILLIDKLEGDMDFIKNMPLKAAALYILKGVGYGEYLDTGLLECDDKSLIIKGFLSIASGYAGIYDFIGAYEKSLRRKERVRSDKSSVKGESRIVLQTVHASKGLEYDIVFIAGLQEGIFPHKRAKSPEEIEEERRLFYVALTRAKERVYLLGRKADDYKKQESRFLRECRIEDSRRQET